MSFDWQPILDPLWHWGAIVTSIALLAALAVWTYQGVRRLRGRPRMLLVGLRLALLVLVLILLLRPSWARTVIETAPGTIVVLIDGTKSMEVRDESPALSRWAAARREWERAQPAIGTLKDTLQIEIAPYQFDTQLRELRIQERPPGERTAITRALLEAFKRHRPASGEASRLYGIVLLSDGRDNVGQPPLEEVLGHLAQGPCPVHVIALGNPQGSEAQPDCIVQSLECPQIARVKDRLTVRGVVQAQRLAGQQIEVWLLLDGQPVKQADDPRRDVFVRIQPRSSNETIPVELPACKLPDRPGELRVTLWAKPLREELTETNNEQTTYLTLIGEGLSVLYIEGRLRAWEPRFLSRALKDDERITLYLAHLLGDDATRARAVTALEEDLARTRYDVFILGDVPAARFPRKILDHLEQAVSKQGSGLLMIGGYDSFAPGGWADTPVGQALPVAMHEAGQLEGTIGAQRDIRFLPTPQGLQHFILRLDSDPQQNQKRWAELPPVSGGSRMGPPKPGASVLARSEAGELLLAVQEYGKGRSAALAVDTTWRWIRPLPGDRPDAPPAGPSIHQRFWRQLILWLARREDDATSVRVELDFRRLAAGKEQKITVRARHIRAAGAHDDRADLAGVDYTVRVRAPDGQVYPVPVHPVDDGRRSQGSFWKTDQPGEYEVEVAARYKDTDLGTARARFMTYVEATELLYRAANHPFLEQIARGTGGTVRQHTGLKELLEQFSHQAVHQYGRRVFTPDWQSTDPRMPALWLALYVLLLGSEWIVRRWYGLV